MFDDFFADLYAWIAIRLGWFWLLPRLGLFDFA